MFTATSTAPPADTGVASAMVNTMQQTGGAIGASVLSTIFASAANSYLHTHTPSPQLTSAAAVHGYTTAFWVAAAIFATGSILIGSLVPSIKPRATPPQPAPAHAQPRVAPKPKEPAAPAHRRVPLWAWHTLHRWVNRQTCPARWMSHKWGLSGPAR
jgi:hypothetical protein